MSILGWLADIDMREQFLERFARESVLLELHTLARVRTPANFPQLWFRFEGILVH